MDNNLYTDKDFKNLYSKKPFNFFEEISKIPRGSGNEEKIADYLEDFAAKRGLFCKRDNQNNVFIRKCASSGFENLPSVMLQAHTDMVCQKDSDSNHDFLNSPIELLTDGEYITANKTTLGADNGAGVAVMLAVLDDSDIKAPEIECLFTVSEETGMFGAFGFDYSDVHASSVINLDSEEERSCCIGCAGGMHVEMNLPLQRVDIDGVIQSIEIDGLCGGHSGVDISLGRTSAISLLGFILNRLYEKFPFHIVRLSGGGRDNVIPFSARATLAFLDSSEAKAAKESIQKIKGEILSILSKDDKNNFKIKLAKEKTCEKTMLSLKSSSALISALVLSPQGVTDYLPDIKADISDQSIIAGSVNLGSVSLLSKETDTSLSDSAKFCFLARSGNPIYSEKTAEKIARLAHALSGNAEITGSFPGWAYKRGGALQSLYSEACERVFGKTPVFTAIHAGLECGVIYEKLAKNGAVPDLISIGPNIYDIHTPSERIDIKSFARLYDTVVYMLEAYGRKF